jgi:hypothetical protein
MVLKGHHDTQHDGIQHNGTQHSNKKATPRTMTLYAEHG